MVTSPSLSRGLDTEVRDSVTGGNHVAFIHMQLKSSFSHYLEPDQIFEHLHRLYQMSAYLLQVLEIQKVQNF